MILDGAIVDVMPKGGVLERIGKILPGDFEDAGITTVSVEVVIGDAATNVVLCKIRDQATALEIDAALKKIADDMVKYISLHR
jgi:23S rRNA U2552 (ribose-2'-O)-methylase RlmE/FtsJ